MPDPGMVQQFTYGPINPIMAYALSFVGFALGLAATRRARYAADHRRRAGWLGFAAVGIGLAGFWLQHFLAMLGYSVTDVTIRYDLSRVIASAAMSIAVVAGGLFIVGSGRSTWWKVVLGGLVIGGGIALMRLVGVSSMRMPAIISFNDALVLTSATLGVIGALLTTWCAVHVNSRGARLTASAGLALIVSAMHYAGMASIEVQPGTNTQTPAGIDATSLLVPIVIASGLTLAGLAFGTLRAASIEDPPPATAPGWPSSDPPGPAMAAPVSPSETSGYAGGTATGRAAVPPGSRATPTSARKLTVPPRRSSSK